MKDGDFGTGKKCLYKRLGNQKKDNKICDNILDIYKKTVILSKQNSIIQQMLIYNTLPLKFVIPHI